MKKITGKAVKSAVPVDGEKAVVLRMFWLFRIGCRVPGSCEIREGDNVKMFGRMTKLHNGHVIFRAQEVYNYDAH